MMLTKTATFVLVSSLLVVVIALDSPDLFEASNLVESDAELDAELEEVDERPLDLSWHTWPLRDEVLQTAEGTKRVPKLDKETGCWVTFVQEQEQEQELQAELREHGRIANKKKKKPQGTADTKGLFSWQISPAPPYTPVARRRRTAKTCPDQCDNDCDLRCFQVMNKDCTPTKRATEEIIKMVKFTGTKDHPKWTLLGTCRDANDKWWGEKGAGHIVVKNFQGKINKGDAEPGTSCQGVIAHVHCPCSHSNGRKLSEDEAWNLILGQLAMIPINTGSGGSGGKRAPVFDKIINMKNAIAGRQMLNCWKSKCAKESDVASLDELLLEDQADATTGWDCG